MRTEALTAFRPMFLTIPQEIMMSQAEHTDLPDGLETTVPGIVIRPITIKIMALDPIPILSLKTETSAVMV